MDTRATIITLPKFLAAILGFAWIFGITGHAFGSTVDYYLKIDGTTNEDATVGPFAGDFPVTAFTFTGAAGGAGSAGEQSLTIKKSIDKASPALIADAVQGKAIGDGGVTLYCVSSGKVFLTYTLTGCLLTSVSDSGDTPSAQKDQIEILSFSWGAANVNLSP